MNYWFWLFIILIPVMVFSVKPQPSMWLRMGRLALAIGVGYGLANAALHWSGTQKREAYEACQSQFPDGEIQHHKECPEINVSGGASYGFYLLFGWVPAAAYAGFFELLWRRRHRQTIRDMGAAFRGKWISNALIIFSIPVWLYIFVVLALFVPMAVLKSLLS
ncbi:MAG: hypothetical protein ABL951_00870 [Alphaproteobacteria bacterium]